MLLLAQQQVLAAEEARDEASKPRFVASAGDSQSARAQAARDRQKRREAVAGLLPDAAGSASSAQSSGSAAAVMVPTGPGLLSGDTLGVGGLDEELEEIRRRVSAKMLRICFLFLICCTVFDNSGCSYCNAWASPPVGVKSRRP